MLKFSTACILFIGSVCVSAQYSGAYIGGAMWYGGDTTYKLLKSSGFNEVILWAIHIDESNGDIYLNLPDPWYRVNLFQNGAWVSTSDNEAFLTDLASLKQGSTSVKRITWSIGTSFDDDFKSIQTLVNTQGTGPDSILYRNFQALKNKMPFVDALDYDDEQNYDVASTTQFSIMVADLGYKVTFSPYTRPGFWQSVYNNTERQRPGTIDCIHLQRYAGGSRNNPGTWNGYFSGLQVSPGLDTSTSSASSVARQMASWESDYGIAGGFIWNWDTLEAGTPPNSPADYAAAIRPVLNTSTPLPTPGNVLSSADFESGLGNWSNAGGDSHNWTRDSGGTPSVNTGPSSGANGSAWYAYLETSRGSANSSGNNAFLESPDVDGSNRKLTFYYHMFGSNIGTLHVDVLSNGTWNNSVWSRSGQKQGSHGAGYTQATVDLSTYSGKIRIRLRAVAAGGWRGDIAIDDIVVTGDGGSPAPGSSINLAPQATISVSSEYVDPNWSKEKLTDGIIGQNANGEWASSGEQTPYAQLAWGQSVLIDKVVLYDRPNSAEKILGGTLTFSDGSSIAVSALPNNGAAKEIAFSRKEVTYVRFQVTNGDGPNIGLSEFQVFGITATSLVANMSAIQ